MRLVGFLCGREYISARWVGRMLSMMHTIYYIFCGVVCSLGEWFYEVVVGKRIVLVLRMSNCML